MNMQTGYCHLSVAPVRAKPLETSEMCTQLLFGELIEIHGIYKSWYQIKTLYDNYEGWVDIKQIILLSEESYKEIELKKIQYTTDIVGLIKKENDEEYFPVLIGSSVYGISEKKFNIGEQKYQYEGELSEIDLKITEEIILNLSFLYLHSPYLWGGTGAFGIDCSGFTQAVYKICGIKLPRNASQQAELGKTVDFLSEVKAGDLAFFKNEEGKIVHTGIIISNNQIIHSSGYVRISKLDHYGIYSEEQNGYSHTLAIIKRIVDYF